MKTKLKKLMIGGAALAVASSPALATDGDYSTAITGAFTTYSTNLGAYATAAIAFAAAVGVVKLVKRLVKSA